MLLWSVSKSLGRTYLGKMSIEKLCARSRSSSNGAEHKSGVVMPSLAGWQSTLLGVPVNVNLLLTDRRFPSLRGVLFSGILRVSVGGER